MLILCDLFVYTGLPEILCNLFGNLFSKVFHTSPYGAFAFFMSLFSGTPANAYLIKNLVNQKKITPNEAEYIFSFSFFTNPLFYFNMLNYLFKGNNNLILKLFLFPYFTNLLLAYIFRPSQKLIDKKISFLEKNTSSFSYVLINSIKNSVNTLLMILGTITIFFIINSLINPSNIPFISGILEISQGLNNLYNLDIFHKILFTLLFISFGGLSIYFQIISIFIDTHISLNSFFKFRFFQCLLAIIGAFLF